MAIEKVRVKTRKKVYKKAYKEKPKPMLADKKSEARTRIDNEVFDVHDSVADNAKWLSVLTTLVMRMYSVMPEDQKAGLSVDDRALIEYTFGRFLQSQTRADEQIIVEGATNVIDKLIDRQAKVGSIVKDIQ